MALSPGTRLGVYEITAQIGEGGMGQVYRATDSRLKRQVAIKILPPAFATDRDRIARFQREAEVLASLNHSNIAGIYGLEESPSTSSGQAGITALVMEFVDGEDLSVRIARGAIPLADALPIAKQIALALEAAHEQGIIHRDLKPANIKVRQDGTVKVLDFGLAKAMEPPAGSSSSFSMSPTLSIHATQAGIILGTAAYMSPEQARGKHVDRRADIWAFGAVLFEMLTGQQPFPGEDISHVLARVIEREPDWGTLPANLPPALATYLRRCFVKDPRERIRDIGDVRLALEGAFDLPAVPERSAAPVVSRSRERLAWAAFGVAMLAALAVAAWTLLRQPPAERQTAFVVSPPQGWTLTVTPPGGTSAQTAPIAVSPDGRRIAFLASQAQGGRSRLWVRSLDTLTAQELGGTDGASSPFWSPDSRSLGFFADGKLKRIDVAGGPPLALCDTMDHRGGTWSRDGVIVFATSNHERLQKVSASGGVASPATTLVQGERGHARPIFLPDGRHFFFYEYASNSIYIGSLDSPDRVLLLKNVDGETAVYTQGHLLFLRGRTLMAQAFDPRTLALAGEPVPIADQIQMLGTPPVGIFSASDAGLLAYQIGGPGRSGADRQLAWFDRSGKPLGPIEKPDQYNNVALSPDGTRVAFDLADSTGRAVDVWVHEFARGTSTRLTFGPGVNSMSAWSPDGGRLVWSSGRDDPLGTILNLYQKASNGTGTDEPLLKAADGTAKYAYDWSPDGHFLLYGAGGGRNIELWVFPLTGNERKPVLYLRQDLFNISQARFSPDGRFVAYASNASGKTEVYVQTFPSASGGKWLVSQGGGNQPRWRRDGKELFYIAEDSKLVAVPVTISPTFSPGVPKPLFAAPIWGGTKTTNVTRYDVTPDGQKFLINTLVAETTPQAAVIPPMTVVLNWTAGLKK